MRRSAVRFREWATIAFYSLFFSYTRCAGEIAVIFVRVFFSKQLKFGGSVVRYSHTHTHIHTFVALACSFFPGLSFSLSLSLLFFCLSRMCMICYFEGRDLCEDNIMGHDDGSRTRMGI